MSPIFFEIQPASLGYQVEVETNIFRQQKSKQRKVKGNIIIYTEILYINTYRNELHNMKETQTNKR